MDECSPSYTFRTNQLHPASKHVLATFYQVIPCPMSSQRYSDPKLRGDLASDNYVFARMRAVAIAVSASQESMAMRGRAFLRPYSLSTSSMLKGRALW